MADPLHSPTLDDISAIAARVLEGLPPQFANAIERVPVLVEDLPSVEVAEHLSLASPFDLLGLYHGVDLASKSVLDAPGDIDRIFLYRRPILAYWQGRDETLEAVVANVLIHEIGHHFGLSDDDMEEIEAGAD